MRVGRRVRRISSNRRFGSDLQLEKQGAGTRNDYGEYQPGATTNMPFRGNIQPASSGAVRDIVAEGARASELNLLIAETSNPDFIRPVRVGSSQTGADVIIDPHTSRRYIARSVKDFSRHGHVEAIIERIDNQNG